MNEVWVISMQSSLVLEGRDELITVRVFCIYHARLIIPFMLKYKDLMESEPLALNGLKRAVRLDQSLSQCKEQNPHEDPDRSRVNEFQ